MSAPPDNARTGIGMSKRDLRVLQLLWGLLIGVLAPIGAAPAAESSLRARLDRLVVQGPLEGASVGIYVERAGDGMAIYERGADRKLIPASNQKILTALAALHRFGPTHRFATRIWSPLSPDAAGVVPRLVVEGGGDPVMNSEDWWRVAADLRREGLRGVQGDLGINDGHFDGPGWHPSWGRVSARAYHAPVGALTANYGSFFVSIWPGSQVGSSAQVDIDPPVNYLRLRNQARTVSRAKRPQLSVDRLPGRTKDGHREEIVRVQGGLRPGDEPDHFPRSVLDPGLYAGSVLAYQLEANGIPVDGGLTRQALDPKTDHLMLEHRGRTLAEIVELCMKYSNNSIGEALVKNLAAYAGGEIDGPPVRQGNWVGGIQALRDELSALGVDISDATLVDGSGLSIQNRLTPRTLVAALRAGRESFRIGPEFVAAMPIAERDGTLEKRLEGGKGRIRAKTGLLSDARATALSGYAERADGEVLIFSIVVNGHRGASGPAMDAVDALARALLDAPLLADKESIGR